MSDYERTYQDDVATAALADLLGVLPAVVESEEVFEIAIGDDESLSVEEFERDFTRCDDGVWRRR